VSYTAIVLAGSRPGGDPLAETFGSDLKPLILIAGEPMVRRPVRALLGSECIGNVVVLSQAPDRISAALPEDRRLTVRKSDDTIAATLLGPIQTRLDAGESADLVDVFQDFVIAVIGWMFGVPAERLPRA